MVTTTTVSHFQVPKKTLYPISFYAPISIKKPLQSSEHFGRPTLGSNIPNIRKKKRFEAPRPGTVMDTFSARIDTNLDRSVFTDRLIKTNEMQNRRASQIQTYNSTNDQRDFSMKTQEQLSQMKQIVIP